MGLTGFNRARRAAAERDDNQEAEALKAAERDDNQEAEALKAAEQPEKPKSGRAKK